MNIKCLICSDLFTSHAEIYGTSCGHLFHYHCLLQWIDRSNTCPQCRTKSTHKTIHRVFLSVEESVDTTDVSTLHNKLDNLQFQLRLKDKDVKNAKENYETASKQNACLREEVKTLEGKMKILESAMHALKEQVTYFKSKSKDVSKMEAELLALKTKISDYKQMKQVLDGNQEELNDMMRQSQSVHSLSILVVTLKRQLIDTEKDKNKLYTSMKNLHAENQSFRRKLRFLKDENGKILKENEEHKNCVKERECLKRTITELNSKQTDKVLEPEKNDINRIVTESPLPLSRLVESNKSSPSISEVVTSIKDSNSPYLQVQTSSIGLSSLIDYNKISVGSNKASIFKQPSMRVQTLKRSLSASSYDGLGGHSQEEHFPSPKHDLASKRLKSTSSATSLKFKKLGSQPKLSFSKLK